MFLIAATLADSPHPALPDVDVVTDVFWSLSTPADGVLQHLRLAAQARIEIVAFLQAQDGPAALTGIRNLCHRVISSSPYLKGWEIHSVELLELKTDVIMPDEG
ncbi:hypothetical protein [Nonomuraea zeae]|uniref:Uncharacterized protein n=1 Tax=Nonomuraea zeae TaxID=1642303 RepID=A0A5S4GUT0_9ACTN|nr:hypothetical protein [Nonomuraea zeae]TMR36706.1 hypothetical protein ETD85_09925 [Nonomuraea zeae]